MASRSKELAKHQSFAKKHRIKLSPMSVGDGVLVAITVIKAAGAPLFEASTKLVDKKQRPPVKDILPLYARAIASKRGSIYASFVTSVDHQKVFYGDQFAIALKRLGVLDPYVTGLEAIGFPTFARTVAIYGPWYLADLVYDEVVQVRKDTTSPITRALTHFGESLDIQSIDCLVESTLTGMPVLNPRSAIALGAANFFPGATTKSPFTRLFRSLMAEPVLDLKKLDKNSSIEATFENFYQHLLANPNALRKLLPDVRYNGVSLNVSLLSRVFRDHEVKRRMMRSFIVAYNPGQHGIRMATLYRAVNQYGLDTALQRAIKRHTGKELDQTGISAVITSLVGLFSIFVDDKKSQMFPMMKAIVG